MCVWQTDSLSGRLTGSARETEEVLLQVQTLGKTRIMNETPAKCLFCSLLQKFSHFLSNVPHQRNQMNESLLIYWIFLCLSFKLTSFFDEMCSSNVEEWFLLLLCVSGLHLSSSKAEELFSFYQYFICIKAGTQTLHQQIFLLHVSSGLRKILMTLLIVSITCDKCS